MVAHPTFPDSPLPDAIRPASRRTWLKGVGALLGTGLLTAPAAVLAAPAAGPAGGADCLGVVKLLAGTALPIGWSRCDGRVLAVAEYPALFAALGATHGGDGIRTFALPHLGAPAAAGVGPAAMQLAIKTADGPATPTALTELRLARRPRSRRA